METSAYHLASYLAADRTAHAGIVVDEALIDVAAVAQDDAPAAARSVLALLQDWPTWHARFKGAAQAHRQGTRRHASMPLSQARLLAPVLYPPTVFCAGANYRDHVAEMSRALNLPTEPDPHEAGLNPWHFIKAARAAVRGTGESIALPGYSRKVDWEAEIAVVIGRECRDVSIDAALQYVAGLSIVNDLSARDHLRRQGVAPDSPFHFDWVSQKCFDGSLPFGPWITPLEFVGDTGGLGIKLWVNEDLMQDSSSSNLIFSMAEQIAHLSTRLTLHPGDVIATGTPAGCGSARGVFLKPGDRVRIWVEDIGELHNDFTAPATNSPHAERALD
jgi:2-keto-4-pentenoate hydratase/2-oxohepta-3-ene-1,7-dioic acid hydratase in catechol pathway